MLRFTPRGRNSVEDTDIFYLSHSFLVNNAVLNAFGIEALTVQTILSWLVLHQALPPNMEPPVQTQVTCPGDPRCTPSVVASSDGGINVNAYASRVLMQGSQCQVDVCDLRESLRLLLLAFNNLGGT